MTDSAETSRPGESRARERRASRDVTLCMLDPDSDDWSPFDSLAHATAPWIIEWLAAYKGWRAMGQWRASGRHVDAEGTDV